MFTSMFNARPIITHVIFIKLSVCIMYMCYKYTVHVMQEIYVMLC